MLPALPQVVRADLLHVVPEQQPFGHEVASHWQAPFTHS
jgi:hypothetical protein